MKCNHCGAQWSVSKEISSQLTSCPFCGAPLFEKEPALATIEDVLREIIRLEGVEVLRNGNRMISFFSDLAPHMTKERRVLRYFVDCNGNTLFLDVRNAKAADQRLRYQQVVYRMCNDLYIAEKAAQQVCSAFWSAVYGDMPIGEPTAPPKPSAPPTPPPAPDAESLYQKGAAYYNGGTANGKPIAQDFAKALPYLRQAAELGHEKACITLGNACKLGRGMQPDAVEAVKWYRKAAEKGNALAQNHMGVCYYNGQGVRQDHVEAARWFQLAADRGNVNSQHNIARAFEHGEGVTKDLVQAAKYYKMAAI